MSLLVWLPLNGSLENRGWSPAKFSIKSNSGAIVSTNNGKISQQAYKRTDIGTIDYISSDVNFNLDKDFSMCCWCKVNKISNPTSANGIITNHSHTTGGAGITLKSNDAGTECYISCNTGYGPNFDQGERTFNTYYGTTNIFGAWHHLCLTYVKQSETYSLYVDGVCEKYFTFKNAAEPRPFCVFAWSTDYLSHSSYKPACDLNDVRLYDNALTGQEIKLLAQGLVAHYPLKAPYLPNLLQGAEEYTKGNPLVRYANVNESNSLQDSYVYHEEITVNIRRSGRYIFILNADGTQAEHKQDDSTNTIENRKYMICLRNKTTNVHPIWADFKIAEDGRHYGLLQLEQGTYDLRTNLYVYDNHGTYTVKFWDMQLFECDKYIPYKFEPLHEDRQRGKHLNQILKIDECFTQDASGYGNHATLLGTPVISENSVRYLTCMDFDGATHLTCGRDAMVTDEITVSCWAYMSDWSQIVNKRIISCTEAGGWNFQAQAESAENGLSFVINIGTSDSHTYHNVTSKTLCKNLAPGWYMLTGTFNGKITEIYIDGIKDSNGKLTEKATRTPIYYHPLNSILIGAEAGDDFDKTESTPKHFDGKISDIRIYGRALTDEEVGKLYNGSASFGSQVLTNVGMIEADESIDNTMTYANFSEKDVPLSNMKIKTLPDGSAWARIHHLDMTDEVVSFTDNEVQDCDVFGKYSKMGLVDNFVSGLSSNYEFMLTYPSMDKGLPSGYTQLEYIESNGQQCINTEVTGGARWEFDIQFKVNGIRQLMGYGGSDNEYWGVQQDGNYGLAKNASWGTIVVRDTYAGKRDIVVHRYNDQGVYSLRAKDAEIGLGANVDVTNKMYILFAYTTGLNGACYTKLYNCNCIQNGKLIRKFIPARRNSDGINGLYDLIEKKFYTNGADNGKNFIAGPKIETYTRLEYIESTGTQYIDTRVSPSLDLETEISFMPTGGLQEHSIFGSTWATNGYFLMFFNKSIRWHSGENWVDIGNYSVGDKVVCHCTNSYITVNGVQYAIAGGENSSNSIKILDNMGYISANSGKGIGKIFYMKMWKNNVVVRDFIPVMSSSGRVGMLDTLHNEFYPSIEGEFIAGPSYGDEHYRLEYIESTGTQYITTDVAPSDTLEVEISLIPTGGLEENAIFGSQWARNGYFLMFYRLEDNKSKSSIRWHSKERDEDIGSFEAGDRVVCHCTNNYITVNGVKRTFEEEIANNNTTNNITIFQVFGDYTNGKPGFFKLEYLKMWENGQLIRDFVPARHSITNKIGLYDLITKRFYNDTNEGAFIAGPEKTIEIKNPSIEQYNRWIQLSSPNANYRQFTGYRPIRTDFTRWDGRKYDAGPITKAFDQSKAAYLVNNSNDPWAPIGQKVPYGNGIRAANNTTQERVELWVRFDTAPDATECRIVDNSIIASDFIEY